MTEPWVLYAGIAVWAGLGGYLVFLAINQQRLARRIAQLEQLKLEDSED
ncbi:MAG TPA: CcmD family protein [Candidatus Desulfovibrio intestinipullorum]|uniref:CcmD family protein n=1 Tax=Candidatus Desulfovibrio intestinipullorum TaxID=2838536 RepID=A0A9D1PW03_9BACT|nr:CcmD family protein [Candidatus Desulfovibrio intestinipullorum]